MSNHASRNEPHSPLAQSKIRRLLGSQQVSWRSPSSLTPFALNSRVHPEAQIRGVMRNIREIGWTNPVLIDESGTILAGHCRIEAATRLGLEAIPTMTLSGLSEAKKKAIVIADNKLAERAEWDFTLLRKNFKELIDVDFEIDLTGFSTGEVDIILDGHETPPADDPLDNFAPPTDGPAVSLSGDVWLLGDHRLLCGDARHVESYRKLLGSDHAEMVVTDPPYNVSIAGHARGRGKAFREFKMASGEMSQTQFRTFLETVVARAIAFSIDGSIHYWFMDWRHLPVLLDAAQPLYSEWKQLLVWNKSNAGQGSFYRSKHELVAVFKNGTDPHINNFGLGSLGRYRANVLDYPGGASLSPHRRKQMDIHPTVKPVALIADLMRDCSRRKGIVLDPFSGSGTVLLAAERSSRIARAMEIDPLYVDAAIKRWEQMTGGRAIHEETQATFVEMAERRSQREALVHKPMPTRRIGGGK